jgi:Na+/H+ antiporter NhaD/arsenite permease-like protein/small-conductance mechanosensitive channel
MNEEILRQVYFGNTIQAYLWFAGIILLGLIFRQLLSKVFSRFIFRFLKKYSLGVGSDKFVELLQKPIGLFILLVTFYIAFDRLHVPVEWNLADRSHFGFRKMFFYAYQLAIILSFTWIILRMIDFVADIFQHKASLTLSKADDQLIPFAKDFIKVLILIVSAFFIFGTVFKMNVASLVAGLGIGGLAVALAAKESLENLFGSFTIFLDKPFVAGDLIKIGNITGHVETIGFRSTRIRTLEKTYVSVPNKKMVEAELDNLSMRTSKRAKFTLGLEYKTSPAQLKKIITDIKTILLSHHLITEDIEVFFYDFGSSSLDLHVLYYVSTKEWTLYAQVREEINFKTGYFPMINIVILIFILGYISIIFEHPLKINKAATAIMTGILCWSAYILLSDNKDIINERLMHQLSEISGILFFLMGAMAIVELIDRHDGFEIITREIKTRNKGKLLWILSLITFFSSAVLDNLTTAIVMVSLVRKLINDKEDRLIFCGMVIIAANAGGAWSPIGDVTTTMLWIGGQITSVNIMKILFIPSLVSLVIPLIMLTFRFRKSELEKRHPAVNEDKKTGASSKSDQYLIFYTGIFSLLFVPVFKTYTHLPPFMGIMFGLGGLWILTEIIHKKKNEAVKSSYSVAGALQRIDVPSILFFLGILLAIASLEATGTLGHLAKIMNERLGNEDLIVMIIGLLSSIVDNVPLVAAAKGMYPLTQYPADHRLWEFIAYCAGTGGSILVIGSAAGVAVMGIEKIDFIWYVKKISFPALIGYFAGAFTYIGMQLVF